MFFNFKTYGKQRPVSSAVKASEGLKVAFNGLKYPVRKRASGWDIGNQRVKGFQGILQKYSNYVSLWLNLLEDKKKISFDDFLEQQPDGDIMKSYLKTVLSRDMILGNVIKTGKVLSSKPFCIEDSYLLENFNDIGKWIIKRMWSNDRFFVSTLKRLTNDIPVYVDSVSKKEKEKANIVSQDGRYIVTVKKEKFQKYLKDISVVYSAFQVNGSSVEYIFEQTVDLMGNYYYPKNIDKESKWEIFCTIRYEEDSNFVMYILKRDSGNGIYDMFSYCYGQKTDFTYDKRRTYVDSDGIEHEITYARESVFPKPEKQKGVRMVVRNSVKGNKTKLPWTYSQKIEEPIKKDFEIGNMKMSYRANVETLCTTNIFFEWGTVFTGCIFFIKSHLDLSSAVENKSIRQSDISKLYASESTKFSELYRLPWDFFTSSPNTKIKEASTYYKDIANSSGLLKAYDKILSQIKKSLLLLCRSLKSITFNKKFDELMQHEKTISYLGVITNPLFKKIAEEEKHYWIRDFFNKGNMLYRFIRQNYTNLWKALYYYNNVLLENDKPSISDYNSVLLVQKCIIKEWGFLDPLSVIQYIGAEYYYNNVLNVDVGAVNGILSTINPIVGIRFIVTSESYIKKKEIESNFTDAILNATEELNRLQKEKRQISSVINVGSDNFSLEKMLNLNSQESALRKRITELIIDRDYGMKDYNKKNAAEVWSNLSEAGKGIVKSMGYKYEDLKNTEAVNFEDVDLYESIGIKRQRPIQKKVEWGEDIEINTNKKNLWADLENASEIKGNIEERKEDIKQDDKKGNEEKEEKEIDIKDAIESTLQPKKPSRQLISSRIVTEDELEAEKEKESKDIKMATEALSNIHDNQEDVEVPFENLEENLGVGNQETNTNTRIRLNVDLDKVYFDEDMDLDSEYYEDENNEVYTWGSKKLNLTDLSDLNPSDFAKAPDDSYRLLIQIVNRLTSFDEEVGGKVFNADEGDDFWNYWSNVIWKIVSGLFSDDNISRSRKVYILEALDTMGIGRENNDKTIERIKSNPYNTLTNDEIYALLPKIRDDVKRESMLLHLIESKRYRDKLKRKHDYIDSKAGISEKKRSKIRNEYINYITKHNINIGNKPIVTHTATIKRTVSPPKIIEPQK